MSILRALESADWGVARALLQECSLPVEDLGEDQMQRFVGVFSGEKLVALGGLEPHGDSVLLRSVCVTASSRGQGWAEKIVLELERRAREGGARTIYLLTETAEAYFQRHAYRREDRDAAPASITASSQFTQVCPASAVFMVKSLV